MTPVPAAGPLGRVLVADDTTVKGSAGYQLGPGANPLVVLRRTAFLDNEVSRAEKAEKAEKAVKGLLRWAAQARLGQEESLVRAAAARRRRAVEASGLEHARVLVRPMWHLAVGLGDQANAHEVGLSLHGTYGWPVIPGSSLKGMARAYARLDAGNDESVTRLLGPPPGAGQHACGEVTFLDALPAGDPVDVAVDVLTPHQQPYYGGRLPPGEHHNPVPFEFLVVCGGSFAVDLLGRSRDDVRRVAEWCVGAVDEIGLGAKTNAGYGYLTPVGPAAAGSAPVGSDRIAGQAAGPPR